MMIYKVFITLIIISTTLFSNNRFEDSQIKIMLKEYFNETPEAPLLLGHKFYKNKNEIIIQLEIQPEIKDINNSILFSFKAMSLLSNIAIKECSHGILVIHLNIDSLPIIAKTELNCAQTFFIDQKINEKKWRKECLTIKNN
jgi:hypothetical protein